jgi:CRISPR-associated protein Csd1
MSFDKEAFRSYGWEQNRNSPVSPDRALAYVLAFNDLLKQDKGRRKDIAGIGFLYWLRNPADLDALDLMDRADPEQWLPSPAMAGGCAYTTGRTLHSHR